MTLDLGENLDGRAGYREHAHDLTRAKAGRGSPREDGLRHAQAPRLTPGKRVKTLGTRRRYSTLADCEVSPLGNRVRCGGKGHSAA